MPTELSPNTLTLSFPPVITGLPPELWIPTSDQRREIGAVCRIDHRSFYYGKSGEALYPDRVARFYPQVHYSSGYSTAAAITGYSASYAGDTIVQLTNASQTFTKDQLAGGYLVIGHAAAANTEFRLITGNSASAGTPGTETIYVTVDHPFYKAHDAATFCEVMVNPYSDVRYGGVTATDLACPAGVAPAGVTAASKYCWFQTWGPRYLCAGGGWTSQGVVGERTVCVVGDGTVNGVMTTAAHEYIIVGDIIQRDTSGSGGPPFIWLKIRY